LLLRPAGLLDPSYRDALFGCYGVGRAGDSFLRRLRKRHRAPADGRWGAPPQGPPPCGLRSVIREANRRAPHNKFVQQGDRRVGGHAIFRSASKGPCQAKKAPLGNLRVREDEIVVMCCRARRDRSEGEFWESLTVACAKETADGFIWWRQRLLQFGAD